MLLWAACGRLMGALGVEVARALGGQFRARFGLAGDTPTAGKCAGFCAAFSGNPLFSRWFLGWFDSRRLHFWGMRRAEWRCKSLRGNELRNRLIGLVSRINCNTYVLPVLRWEFGSRGVGGGGS